MPKRKRFVVVLCVLLSSALLLAGCAAPNTEESAVEVFTFVYMSDLHANPSIGDYTPNGYVMANAFAHAGAPQLLVLGGDNVNNASCAEDWADFWKGAAGHLEGITVASVAGNHCSGPLLAQQFDYPNTAPERSTEGFFYTFTAGNIFFLMLDTNIMGAGNASDAQWLSQQLSSDAARDADWIIAVGHHPFWPIVEVPRDAMRAQTMREVFLPLMEAGGVDLILSGHQHVYARTEPMLAGVGMSENGIMQILAATGPKIHYQPTDKDYIAIAKQIVSYLIVETTVNTLRVTAYDGEGQAFDSVQISR